MCGELEEGRGAEEKGKELEELVYGKRAEGEEREGEIKSARECKKKYRRK